MEYRAQTCLRERSKSVRAFIWTCLRCHQVLNEDNDSLDWAERVKIYICIVKISMKSLIISHTAPVQ